MSNPNCFTNQIIVSLNCVLWGMQISKGRLSIKDLCIQYANNKLMREWQAKQHKNQQNNYLSCLERFMQITNCIKLIFVQKCYRKVKIKFKFSARIIGNPASKAWPEKDANSTFHRIVLHIFSHYWINIQRNML